MLLAIDIGNTSITFGVFSGKNLLKKFRLPSNTSPEKYEAFLMENTDGLEINSCIISSVVSELDSVFYKIINKIYGINPMTVSHNMKLNFDINLDQPETLGADRIANAAAAKELYKLPVLIADIGTATTFDILDKDGNFVGGLIMPGIKLQLETLNTNTSKLPLIDIGDTENAVAKNTKDAILAGVVLGHAHAIEGLIRQSEKELGENLTVIGSGGYADLIAKHLPHVFKTINHNLTLEGLRILHEKNCKI